MNYGQIELNEKDFKTLSYVMNRCKEHSGFLTHIINAGVSGIEDKVKELQHHAADMETFASAMTFLVGQKRVSPKLKKQMSDLALHKLQNHYGKTFINWNDQITENLNEK